MNVLQILNAADDPGRYAKLTVMLGPGDKFAGEILEKIQPLYKAAHGEDLSTGEAIDLIVANMAYLLALGKAQRQKKRAPKAPAVNLVTLIVQNERKILSNEEIMDVLVDVLWWAVTISSIPRVQQTVQLSPGQKPDQGPEA